MSTETVPATLARIDMARFAKGVTDGELARMHRWTRMAGAKATGIRKTELAAEQGAIEAEATTRGVKLGCGHGGDPHRLCSECAW